MSRLRRTGRATFEPHILRCTSSTCTRCGVVNLHPPSTSSLGTAYFSTLLANRDVRPIPSHLKEETRMEGQPEDLSGCARGGIAATLGLLDLPMTSYPRTEC